MKPWMIFTDLDGTLLDHDDYRFTEALPSLTKIKQLNIPLIINSSKTDAEIQDIRQKLHNNWAYAVENGAALFLPDGKLNSSGHRMEKVILGTAQKDILDTLKNLRQQYGFSFKGISEFTPEELATDTGLSVKQATQAKQRIASEPIKWRDSDNQLALFRQSLQQQGFQLIQGGRFLHVMGKNDKSEAMAWLLNAFNQQHTQTIALGDSQNDLKMLEKADFSVVIQKRDGSHLQLDRTDRVIYSQHPAPLGWQKAMDQLFTQLNIGACNE